MSVYRCEILQSITEIPRSVWEALSPSDDPIWSWSHAHVTEQTGIGPDGFEYIVLLKNDQAVAILPAFWYRAMPLVTALHPSIDKALNALRGLVPGIASMPVYFCGHPLGDGRILTESPLSKDAASLLMDTVRTRTAHHGLAWSFLKDFDPRQSQDLLGSLDDDVFFGVDGLPDASLYIDYPDFESFVTSRSANTRRNIRKRMRAFDKSPDLRIETIDRFDQYLPQINRLYDTVFSRAKLTFDRLSPEYFEAVAHNDGIDRRFVACFAGDRMIGFILNVFGRDGGVCFRGGFDYERSHEAGVYFVLQYESIRQAIEAGCQRLSFCQATYKPKLQLGCDLLPTRHIITHRNPAQRALARRLMPALFARYRRHCGLTEDMQQKIYPPQIARRPDGLRSPKGRRVIYPIS